MSAARTEGPLRCPRPFNTLCSFVAQLLRAQKDSLP